jgi:hypothetical protein
MEGAMTQALKPLDFWQDEHYEEVPMLDDPQPFWYEDDCPAHAPSDFVAHQRELREERKRRDREDLQDLWREETLRRKRENAARFCSHWRQR